MIAPLEKYLNSLKMSETILDWRSNPGYGFMEYTMEVPRKTSIDVKKLEQVLGGIHKATNIKLFKDDQIVAIKFIVRL